MGYRVLQNSFNGGEVSPALYGRFDDQKYNAGAAAVRNFICLPQGPVVNRPGFAYVNAAKYADKKVRLIPFVYSSEQTMALEFGEKYIRFHTEGQTLIKSDGTPYEIASPYAADDLFSIHYTQSADVLTLVHPSYAPRELRRYGPYDWRLVEIDFTLGIEPPTGLAVSYTCGNNDATGKTNYRPYYRITAIKDNDNGGYTESEPCAAVSIACNLYIDNSYNTLTWNSVEGASRYRVYKTYSGVYGLLGETEETKYTDTNFDTDTSITPPRLDEVFFSSGGISSVTVTNGGSGYGYVINGVVDATCGFGGTMSRYKKDASESEGSPPKITVSVTVSDKDGQGEGATAVADGVTYTYSTSKNQSGHVDHYYRQWTTKINVTKIKITNPGHDYISPVATVKFTATGTGWDGDSYSWSREVTLDKQTIKPTVIVSDTTGRGAELEAVVTDGKVTQITIVRPGYGYSSPTITISGNGTGATATASVNKTGDYPSAVTYFQQRRVFAGSFTYPRMVWMTASGTESSFVYTIPSQADNRVRFELAAQEASRILHVAPLSSLIVITGSSELRVVSSDGGPITSESISASPQASIGASDVQPVIVNSALLYAANRGGHIRELGYNYQASGFTTGDLSIRAAHLFENVTTVDMARMKTPDSIIWFVMSDGNLLGLTYLPEQSVAAWHRHDTDGAFESVCCVPEGQEDALYAVVRRTINGGVVRYIERMKERHFEGIEDAFRVDCGATYKGASTTTISGLTWLEGKTVSVLGNGGVLPSQVVENGKITLPSPVTYAHIGLPITSELKTLPAGAQFQDGSYGRGHMKNVNKVFIRVYRSSGLFVGPDEDHLTEMKPRHDETFGSAPELKSEEIPLAVSPKWTDSGQIVIRQTAPLPLTVVSWAADFAQ